MRIRISFSSEEKSFIWREWRKGGSAATIAQSMTNRSKSSVHCLIGYAGGFAPRPHVRRAGSLTLEEREEISRGLALDWSGNAIATCLGREPSTISREIARNGGRKKYRAAEAESRVTTRARRPKLCKLAQSIVMRNAVSSGLSKDWSPEQISKSLRLMSPDDPDMQISPETIYRSLFIQARGVLKKELCAHLRTRRSMRHPKTQRRASGERGIPDAVSISERPACVEDRAVAGHWEGDLIQGAGFSYVATLVERQTRYLMLVKLENKTTDIVVAALKKHIVKLPAELRQSLTWDRGCEMAAHKRFTIDTNVAVYFCDPASPWQRGSNENTNGLLRQYFRPGIDLRDFSQANLNALARRINERPRKTLGFQTPASKLEALLR